MTVGVIIRSSAHISSWMSLTIWSSDLNPSCTTVIFPACIKVSNPHPTSPHSNWYNSRHADIPVNVITRLHHSQTAIQKLHGAKFLLSYNYSWLKHPMIIIVTIIKTAIICFAAFMSAKQSKDILSGSYITRRLHTKLHKANIPTNRLPDSYTHEPQ